MLGGGVDVAFLAFWCLRSALQDDNDVHEGAAEDSWAAAPSLGALIHTRYGQILHRLCTAHILQDDGYVHEEVAEDSEGSTILLVPL
jgi:hypothetical protein